MGLCADAWREVRYYPDNVLPFQDVIGTLQLGGGPAEKLRDEKWMRASVEGHVHVLAVTYVRQNSLTALGKYSRRH